MTERNDPWPLVVGGRPARGGSDADDPFPPSGGSRRRARQGGIPQQQPSEAATGPMAVTDTEPAATTPPAPAAPSAPPAATTATTTGAPGAASSRPRSRREALAAERAARLAAAPLPAPGDSRRETAPDPAPSARQAPSAPQLPSRPVTSPRSPSAPSTQSPSTQSPSSQSPSPRTLPFEPVAAPGPEPATPQTVGSPPSLPVRRPTGGAPGRDPFHGPALQSLLTPGTTQAPPERAPGLPVTGPDADAAPTALLTASDAATAVAPVADPDVAAGTTAQDDATEDGSARRADRRVEPTVRPSGRRLRLGRLVLPLITLLIALTAAATVAPWNNSLLVLLAATAPLAALVAVPVVALAVHHHRRILALVAGVAAILPWALVVGYATADEPAVTGGAPLRIMLVNGNEGQVDAAGVVTAVRDHGIDVLVINELTPVLAHDLTTAGMGAVLQPQYVGEAAAEGGQLGVWSRPQITDTAPVAGTSRPAMIGVIRTDAGPVRLVAGHAPRPYPGDVPFFADATAWAGDLDAFAAAAAGDGPRVLVGDLNATPWNRQFRDLEATSGLRDAGDALGKGLRPTWPVWSPLPLSPIDHILVGGGLGVGTVGTTTLSGSNHRALVVELEVPRNQN